MAAGLGAAIVTGHGTATAAPSSQDSASPSGPSAGATPRDSKPAAGPHAGAARTTGAGAGPRTARAVATHVAVGSKRLPATTSEPAAQPTRRPNAALAAIPTNSADSPSSPPPGPVASPAPSYPAAVSLADAAVRRNPDGTVRTISGSFIDRTVTDKSDAAAVFNDLAGLLGTTAGFANPDDITVQRAGGGNQVPGESDGFAETFYRITTRVNGVVVRGGEIILATDGNGAVTGLFNYRDARVDSVDTTPDARVDDATKALALVAQAYLATGTRTRSGGDRRTSTASPDVAPQLVVDTVDFQSEPRLVWRVVIDAPSGGRSASPSNSGTATYLVYASGPDAGTVLRQNATADALFPSTSVASTATDQLGHDRAINVTSTHIFFFDLQTLGDMTRGISTYQTAYFFGIGPPLLPGHKVGLGLLGWDPSAVSAQANMAVAYDYYADVLGRTSFDDDGAPIKISVNYSPRSSFSELLLGYSNAIWDPDNQQFAFGNLNHFQTALDVVGHEYTHAVISYIVGNGGSVWESGESGALNEAYADIMGSFIEGKTDAQRWNFGENTGAGILRNLANPAAINTTYGSYAATYATRYTGTEDDGGEHLNSTIFSHAAYEMMTNPATSDITEDTWASLFYHSLYRLGTSADFTDGRNAVIDTAVEFGFTATQLDAIQSAFDDVGIAG